MNFYRKKVFVFWFVFRVRSKNVDKYFSSESNLSCPLPFLMHDDVIKWKESALLGPL